MFDVFGWAELALGARWWHPEARFLDFDGNWALSLTLLGIFAPWLFNMSPAGKKSSKLKA